ETAQTEINGKNLRSFELSRGFDRMLACAAASYQNFELALLGNVAEGDQRELASHVPVNCHGFGYRRRLHPPRIWAFLVLLLNQKRHAVLNRGEARNGGLQLPLFLHLPHLACRERSHGGGPRSFRNQLRDWKRSERKIRRNS